MKSEVFGRGCIDIVVHCDMDGIGTFSTVSSGASCQLAVFGVAQNGSVG